MKIMSDSEFKSRLKQAHKNGYNAGYVACLRNQERLAERADAADAADAAAAYADAAYAYAAAVDAVDEAFRKGEKIE